MFRTISKIYVRMWAHGDWIPTPVEEDVLFALGITYHHTMGNACGAEGPDGHFICSREPGHEGIHVACAGRNDPVAVWENTEEVENDILHDVD